MSKIKNSLGTKLHNTWCIFLNRLVDKNTLLEAASIFFIITWISIYAYNNELLYMLLLYYCTWADAIMWTRQIAAVVMGADVKLQHWSCQVTLRGSWIVEIWSLKSCGSVLRTYDLLCFLLVKIWPGQTGWWAGLSCVEGEKLPMGSGLPLPTSSTSKDEM